MAQHGSTINRKYSQYDAHVTARVKRTDLATVAKWLVSQGDMYLNRSRLVQACVDMAVRFVISHGAEHISSTEEAAHLLSVYRIDNLNPGGRGEFAFMRKLQEEGKLEPDSTPVEEEKEVEEVPVKKKRFEDLDPEMQQAAIDGGYRPDLGRYETIEERDKKMKESLDVSLEQLRKQGTLVEPENDEQD